MTSQIHAERPWSSLLAFMAGAVAVAGLLAYLIVSQHREVLRSWKDAKTESPTIAAGWYRTG